MGSDDVAQGRERAGQHRDPGLPSLRGKSERILLPRSVFVRKARFDLGPRQPFPVTMRNLTQPLTEADAESAAAGDDFGRIGCPGERTGIRRGEPLRAEALAKARRLETAFIRQIDANRPGESAFGRQLRGTVPHKKHASDRYNHRVILLAIALGGGTGALLRHLATQTVQARFGAAFPLGIFLVNVVGCLAIGMFAGLIAANRIHVGELGRAFVVVGILGGFTTFSSFGLDTFTLARAGQLGAAALNAFGQLFAGLAAVWLGYALSHVRL